MFNYRLESNVVLCVLMKYKIQRMMCSCLGTKAYNKGVVVVTCKGCDSQHMIADNLGWSNHPGGFEGADTIEDYLEKKGQGDSVTRVSQEVWDLEHLMEESSTLSSLPEEEIYDEERDLPDDNGIFD